MMMRRMLRVFLDGIQMPSVHFSWLVCCIFLKLKTYLMLPHSMWQDDDTGQPRLCHAFHVFSSSCCRQQPRHQLLSWNSHCTRSGIAGLRSLSLSLAAKPLASWVGLVGWARRLSLSLASDGGA